MSRPPSSADLVARAPPPAAGDDPLRLLALALGATSPDRPPAWAAALVALPQRPDHLSTWVLRYLAIKLGGRSPHTVAARGRDLLAFCRWFQEALGHLDIGAWMPAHTQHYLRALAQRRLAPTSINRALWSLKHFAGWVSRQPGGVFSRWGHPAEEAREIKVEEAPCKKITDAQASALFAAADGRARAPRGHALERPHRDAAILAVLSTCGLRVSELVHLRRGQYRGGDLHEVSRKGGAHSRMVLLCAGARRRLDAYLAVEWQHDANLLGPAAAGEAALFLAARSGRPLDRARVARILARLAGLAAGDASAGGWHVHPHQLRHTFGAHYRAASGSDTETAAALGHASLKYVGRYVRKSTGERRRLLESMFADADADADADAPPPEGED